MTYLTPVTVIKATLPLPVTMGELEEVTLTMLKDVPNLDEYDIQVESKGNHLILTLETGLKE